jgi:hypothetical protein
VSKVTKGALIEYGSDFLGPLPNVVIFQYNIEELSRQFAIQRRRGDDNVPARQTETHSAFAAPVESFTLTLKFDAADDLDADDPIATVFGVGPQLAALEKMANPAGGSALLGAVMDAVGDLLGGGGGGATRPIPPERLPRLLFVAGPTKAMPVEITSFAIRETLFDRALQPIRAEVTIGLEVVTFPPDSDDLIGQGALEYQKTVKDAQAVLNLGKAIVGVTEIIPF